ncbi:hypothetical protein [Yanghanlia caeni]|uniref:restriction endonuclease n=1 Tax=Yanghanlia caeni TaxID=3064283 RepID=UPI003D2FEA39
MSALTTLLDTYRKAAVSEREKGTYFEELILTYLRTEATYRDLYSDVWTYADWAKQQGLDGHDAGIDLVAKTRGTEELHAHSLATVSKVFSTLRSRLTLSALRCSIGSIPAASTERASSAA